jgi:hypothetical protein
MNKPNKRIRTNQELEAISQSWCVDEMGVLRWKRKPFKGNIGDVVPMKQNQKRSLHRRCRLFLNQKEVRFYESNVIWFLRNGEWPDGIVEHKDGNPLNNLANNHRIANYSENACNCKTYSNNTTGVKGVYARPNGYWQVTINKDYKRVYLGTYKSLETAKIVRKLAEQRFHGEFARGLK